MAETKTIMIFRGQGRTEKDECAVLTISAGKIEHDPGVITVHAPDGKSCAIITLAEGVKSRVVGA